MINEAAEFSDAFGQVAVGEPLLTSDADFDAVIAGHHRGTRQSMTTARPPSASWVTEPRRIPTDVYAKMQEMLAAAGYENYYVGTVEAEPTPGRCACGGRGRRATRRWFFSRLMIVAGDHANNDMAGDGEGTWKNAFEKAGYEVICRLKGLGEMEAIQKIFVEHAQAAMDSLAE